MRVEGSKFDDATGNCVIVSHYCIWLHKTSYNNHIYIHLIILKTMDDNSVYNKQVTKYEVQEPTFNWKITAINYITTVCEIMSGFKLARILQCKHIPVSSLALAIKFTVPTVPHLPILFESPFSTFIQNCRGLKGTVYPMPFFFFCIPSKWPPLKWTVPQVEIEILFLMMVWGKCMLCRDNRKDYSVLLLSNFYVKKNGLQTGKEKKNVGKRKIKCKVM